MEDQRDFSYTGASNPFTVEEAYDGITRHVLSFTDELLMVRYELEDRAEFPEHEHERTHQAVFVIDGSIELFGDESRILSPGDSFVVGPGVRHGIRAREEAEVVDVFHPPIERYIDG